MFKVKIINNVAIFYLKDYSIKNYSSIIFVHNTIANLFRIVEAVVATVNQKRQLLVPVTLNELVIIDKV